MAKATYLGPTSAQAAKNLLSLHIDTDGITANARGSLSIMGGDGFLYAEPLRDWLDRFPALIERIKEIRAKCP